MTQDDPDLLRTLGGALLSTADTQAAITEANGHSVPIEYCKKL